MNAKYVTVVALFQAKPGREAELKTALTGLLVPTRKEEGCVNYDLHFSPEDSTRFMFHENWTTRAALDKHAKSAHLQALLPQVGDLCAIAPDIQIWEKLD
ncbi:MAG TPA: putative quinol monooxygenase [Dongiaceae bacterium]|jgi:quinol monooxygenase YgiN|nr:putative quinol monooxygenase [Dongiaceae bacterium]